LTRTRSACSKMSEVRRPSTCTRMRI
jgi:hypothetical protein